jgi:CBF1 interacting corepressor
MGKIGEFLNNKPWHPSSRQNQTLLFEAEERQREEQQRLEERQEELKQERAREELDALLPNRGGAKPAGIDFMYKAPTGTNTSGAAPRAGAADEAALAFEARRLAAARRKRGEPEPVVERPPEPEVLPEPEPEKPSKTFDAHAETRRVDPAERQRNMTSAAIAQTALDARNRLVLKAAATAAVASDGVVRAHGSANEGYAMLDDEDEDENEDAALLASLSSREKRALLKRLAGDDERPKKKRKKKHKKKSKKKKKRRSSSSSSGS